MYDPKTGHADAILTSMFRFPDSSELHFQCDIEVCRGICTEPDCDDVSSNSLALQQSKDVKGEAQQEEGTLLASTSVFVLQPGETPRSLGLCDDSSEGGIRPPWLLYLCIAFGLMFLIMLIINVFLCSAMTCSCARTDIIEKEPSIIEDYDPYRSWHGSQYGSRYQIKFVIKIITRFFITQFYDITWLGLTETLWPVLLGWLPMNGGKFLNSESVKPRPHYGKGGSKSEIFII